KVLTMTTRPYTNALVTRATVAAGAGGAGAGAGHAVNVSTGTPASASPPTNRHHQVATASTSHSRSARPASVMRDFCQSQPPLLTRLNPGSIHARKPYQHTAASCGGRSVSTSQGSLYPASQRASRVQPNRLGASLNASPVPHHWAPTRGTNVCRARRRFSPAG